MIIYVTDWNGKVHELESVSGWRLMEIIRDYGMKNHALAIKAECGGACACATCHVYVDAAWKEKLIPPSREEIGQLDRAFDVREESRLSCQIIMDERLNGLRITLAPGSEL